MAYTAETDNPHAGGILIVGWPGMRAHRIAYADRAYGAPPPTKERLMDTLAAWVNAGNPEGRDMSVAGPITKTWTGGGEFIPHSREEVEYCRAAAANLPSDTVLVGVVPPDSRKQFILLAEIAWAARAASQKYYEIPL